MSLKRKAEHVRFLVNQGGLPKLWHHMQQNIMFDVKHGTDTSGWLRKVEFEVKPPNFEHGVRYRASATSEINKSLQTVSDLIETSQAGYYDLGCGKGKTLCMVGMRENYAHIMGIDYYAPFLESAQENLDICRLDNVELREGDMTEFKDYMETSVIFMYNPAEKIVIEKVRDNLEKLCRRAIVIYNKPLHEKVFQDWDIVSRKVSRDPDHTTSIYAHGFSEFELHKQKVLERSRRIYSAQRWYGMVRSLIPTTS